MEEHLVLANAATAAKVDPQLGGHQDLRAGQTRAWQGECRVLANDFNFKSFANDSNDSNDLTTNDETINDSNDNDDFARHF